MYRSEVSVLWYGAARFTRGHPTPLSPIVSSTVETPDYVVESDPEEDPDEYEDDKTEDGSVDNPMDRGDDGDDDDDNSSGDDADEEDEEEEYLASADSAIVIPTDELPAISLPSEAEVEILLAMPTPPPSPLASLSPPSAGERLARLASTQALIDVVTVTIPSPPLPPPLYIPPHIDRKDDIFEIEMPPRKRLCLSTLGFRYEIGEGSTARLIEGQGIDYGFVSTLDAEARRRGIGGVGYGIRDTWVDPVEAVPKIIPMTVGEVNTRVTELAEIHEHDTHDLYALLKDAHDSRTRISQQVAMDSQRVDLLMEDRIAHRETILIMEEEAYMQQTEIAELRETDRRRQAQMIETLRVMGDMRRDMGDMQAELLALREQPRRARYQIRSLGLDAYSMTWEVLKKKMTDKYCPQGEIKKLEIELWNLKKGRRTTKGRLMIRSETTMVINNNPSKGKMSPRSTIWGRVKGSRTVEIYPSAPKVLATLTLQMLRGTMGANPKGNGCFECEAPGHFKRDFPKLKNKYGGNVNAQGWVYAVGNAERKENASRDPDSNVVTGTFLLNNRYASILFDTGADRSFISTAFSSLIDIVPTPLGNSYDVELADGKIVGSCGLPKDLAFWSCVLPKGLAFCLTVLRPNGEALRKCIMSGPYKPTTLLVHDVEATDNSPAVAEHTTVETPANISSAPSPKPLIPTRSHTTTRHKGKEIAKLITPPSETASEEDNNPEQAQRDKDMQNNLALIANQSGQFGTQRTVNVAGLREKVGSPVVQKFRIQCFNCKEYGHFAKDCRKLKMVKDFAYHKEKMLLCKQVEQGVPLQAEQYDWLADMDEEVDEQELEAHYNYMAKIQEVPTAKSGTDSEPVEHVQNNVGYNEFANVL
nr:hypothetical protein [Tanacetum cinerariifolium]